VAGARHAYDVGELETSRHVIPALVRAARSEGAFEFNRFQRDFIHVGDVARLLARAATQGSPDDVGVYEVGRGKAVSETDLLDVAAEVMPEFCIEQARLVGEPKGHPAKIVSPTASLPEFDWGPQKALADMVWSEYEWQASQDRG